MIHKKTIYLILTILAGLILRLYNLGTESFWFDEVITIYLISQDFHEFIQQITTQSVFSRNAVYFATVYFWTLPLEITEVSIRSLSVLFGVLSIYLMYLVGQKLFGARIGLIASFLMAVSAFQIQHSQEARFYSLFVLLTLISMYYYLLASKENSSWLWIISSFVNVLLFYTHSYALFIFIAEYLHFLIYIKQNKNSLLKWSVAQIPLVVIIANAIIPMVTERELTTGFGSGLAWISPPSLAELVRTIVSYILPRQHEHSWSMVWARTALAVTFLISSIFLLNRNKTLFALLKNKYLKIDFQTRVDKNLILVIIWFIFPILIPFFYSIIFTPIFVDRYTICAAPAFYLLIAYILSRVNQVVPIFISLATLLIIILPGLQDYYSANTNEQWREVALYVQENAEENEVVLFIPDDDGFQHKSFDWYYEGKLSFCGITSKTTDEQAIMKTISDCTFNRERFWIVVRGSLQASNFFNSFFLSLNQTDFYLITERSFVGISVYLFESQ